MMVLEMMRFHAGTGTQGRRPAALDLCVEVGLRPHAAGRIGRRGDGRDPRDRRPSTGRSGNRPTKPIQADARLGATDLHSIGKQHALNLVQATQVLRVVGHLHLDRTRGKVAYVNRHVHAQAGDGKADAGAGR